MIVGKEASPAKTYSDTDSDRTAAVITHLVCDCDGVLVDSEALAYVALLDALTIRLAPTSRKTLAEAIQRRLGVTTEAMLEQVATEAGTTLSAAEVAAIQTRVEAVVRAHQQAVPGTAAALHALALPIAVASNSSLPRVREAIAVCGIGALVGERIYTADVVGKAKPAPDIYLAACAGFGVPPTQCVAVEDSVTGVTAAASAGLRVIGFVGASHIGNGSDHAHRLTEHIKQLGEAGASWIVDDMRDLPHLIETIARGSVRNDT